MACVANGLEPERRTRRRAESPTKAGRELACSLANARLQLAERRACLRQAPDVPGDVAGTGAKPSGNDDVEAARSAVMTVLQTSVRGRTQYRETGS